MIRKHLARKGAFMYTHTWNKTFGEKVGMYPKFYPGNNERYKRAGVYMKAMSNAMKIHNLKTTPVYRGMSENQMKSLLKNGEINRNTFTSFSYDRNTASSFSNGGIIIILDDKVPGIRYNQKNFISQYNIESEFLLPPGKFTINRQVSPGLIKVSFTPKVVNFNALERNASKKYVYTKIKISNTIPDNLKWKSVRNLDQIRAKREMLNKLKNDFKRLHEIEVQYVLKKTLQEIELQYVPKKNFSNTSTKRLNLIRDMKSTLLKKYIALNK